MQLIYDSGYFVYATIRDEDGLVYNHVTEAFELWSDGNLIAEAYDYSLTDQGGDQYLWTFPALDEGEYTIIHFMRSVEGAPPDPNDLLLPSLEISWDGSALVDPETPPTGSYISNTTGDTFAAIRLNTESWDEASSNDKTAAVRMATEIIDTLNYIGDRTEDEQDLEFPRGSDTEIPIAIQRACFEIALALLDGAEPEIDFANQNLVSQGIANVRSTYNRNSPLPHIIAGVPSSTAWRYLLPFLRDRQAVTISRVS